jgi:hypothetical protein
MTSKYKSRHPGWSLQNIRASAVACSLTGASSESAFVIPRLRSEAVSLLIFSLFVRYLTFCFQRRFFCASNKVTDSPNDTERMAWSATTPLKPKEGLNGPPQASLVEEGKVISLPTCRRQVGRLGMTKGGALSFGCDAGSSEQQVPPLRYAPVGMTNYLRHEPLGTSVTGSE